MSLLVFYIMTLIFSTSCSDEMKIEVKGAALSEQNSLEVISLELTDGSGVNESATETNLSWSSYAAPEEELKLMSDVSYKIAYKAGSLAPKDCSSDTLIEEITGNSHRVSNLVESDTYSFRVCALDSKGEELASGTQTVKFKSWQLEVTTSTANEILAIGLDSASPFVVDWGDNSRNVYNLSASNKLVEHRYASAGVYTLKLRGKASRINFDNPKARTKITKILSKVQGIGGITSFEASF